LKNTPTSPVPGPVSRRCPRRSRHLTSEVGETVRRQTPVGHQSPKPQRARRARGFPAPLSTHYTNLTPGTPLLPPRRPAPRASRPRCLARRLPPRRLTRRPHRRARRPPPAAPAPAGALPPAPRRLARCPLRGFILAEAKGCGTVFGIDPSVGTGALTDQAPLKTQPWEVAAVVAPSCPRRTDGPAPQEPLGIAQARPANRGDTVRGAPTCLPQCQRTASVLRHGCSISCACAGRALRRGRSPRVREALRTSHLASALSGHRTRPSRGHPPEPRAPARAAGTRPSRGHPPTA
jgi:hypothetical protein